MKITFFDCNCMVGKQQNRREGEPYAALELQTEMAYFGIHEALVVHALSRDYNAVVGNKEITRIKLENMKIYPVWAILPPGADEVPPPKQFIENMMQNSVGATIAYPMLHKFSLSHWSMGELFKELNHHRIPLILPFNQATWEEVFQICQQFPDLPVIITTLDYRQLRYLLPLWQTCSNLYVDISWFSIAKIMSYLNRKGHIRNLLFGTNYPKYTPGGAVAMVTYADVNEQDKKKIAGDNLREIIAGIRRD
ncbi:amidohydrolase family protein [candidate division KSB1 bacterium]|nr:amidohydrolase family protein [candidate division KSB1 bacterium]